MKRLDGKIVIITGAARGIGAAAARLFAREGARLMLADLREAPLRDLAAEIGDNAATSLTDVTDETAMRKLVDDTVARFGRLDAAVFNAGVSAHGHDITDYPADMFDRVMAVNVRGVWLGLKYAMRAMAETGGSIVITSSTAGVRGTTNCVGYVVSKHAEIGLMRVAALEGASKRIRVNTVNPATIETPMVAELDEKARAEGELRHTANAIPLGRFGKPEEVANLMLFLASDEASFCTGGVYMVDGGISAGRTPPSPPRAI